MEHVGFKTSSPGLPGLRLLKSNKLTTQGFLRHLTGLDVPGSHHFAQSPPHNMPHKGKY
jgi:hypothetical protein